MFNRWQFVSEYLTELAASRSKDCEVTESIWIDVAVGDHPRQPGADELEGFEMKIVSWDITNIRELHIQHLMGVDRKKWEIAEHMNGLQSTSRRYGIVPDRINILEDLRTKLLPGAVEEIGGGEVVAACLSAKAPMDELLAVFGSGGKRWGVVWDSNVILFLGYLAGLDGGVKELLEYEDGGIVKALLGPADTLMVQDDLSTIYPLKIIAEKKENRLMLFRAIELPITEWCHQNWAFIESDFDDDATGMVAVMDLVLPASHAHVTTWSDDEIEIVDAMKKNLTLMRWGILGMTRAATARKGVSNSWNPALAAVQSLADPKERSSSGNLRWLYYSGVFEMAVEMLRDGRLVEGWDSFSFFLFLINIGVESGADNPGFYCIQDRFDGIKEFEMMPLLRGYWTEHGVKEAKARGQPAVAIENGLKRLEVNKRRSDVIFYQAPNENICDVCGVTESKACLGCSVASYCSKSCQRVGWKDGHKRDCVPYGVKKEWLSSGQPRLDALVQDLGKPGLAGLDSLEELIRTANGGAVGGLGDAGERDMLVKTEGLVSGLVGIVKGEGDIRDDGRVCYQATKLLLVLSLDGALDREMFGAFVGLLKKMPPPQARFCCRSAIMQLCRGLADSDKRAWETMMLHPAYPDFVQEEAKEKEAREKEKEEREIMSDIVQAQKKQAAHAFANRDFPTSISLYEKGAVKTFCERMSPRGKIGDPKEEEKKPRRSQKEKKDLKEQSLLVLSEDAMWDAMSARKAENERRACADEEDAPAPPPPETETSSFPSPPPPAPAPEVEVETEAGRAVRLEQVARLKEEQGQRLKLEDERRKAAAAKKKAEKEAQKSATAEALADLSQAEAKKKAKKKKKAQLICEKAEEGQAALEFEKQRVIAKKREIAEQQQLKEERARAAQATREEAEKLRVASEKRAKEEAEKLAAAKEADRLSALHETKQRACTAARDLWLRFSSFARSQTLAKPLLAACRTIYNSKISTGGSLSYWPFLRLGGARQDVFLGRRPDGKICAIKKQPLSVIDTKEDEVRVLQDLNHPNVVKLYHYEQNLEHYFMALELCRGTLNDLTQRSPSLLPHIKLDLVRQIAQAVQFLHSNDVAHRDLKPSNVLFVESSKGIEIRVADFGISKMLDEHATSYTVTNGHNGTKGYQAREFVLFRGGDHPVKDWRPTNDDYKKADVFALGLVIHSLLSGGLHPFSHPKKRNREEVRIEDGEEPNLNHLLEYEARHFVERCVNHAPEARLSANEALGHPFFYDTEERVSVVNKVWRLLKSGQMELDEEWHWKEKFGDCMGGDGKMLGGHYKNTGRELLRLFRNVLEHADEYGEDSLLRESFRAHVRDADVERLEVVVAKWIQAKEETLWCKLWERDTGR